VSAPVCHRFAAAYVTGATANPAAVVGRSAPLEADPSIVTCIGSRCALWVPIALHPNASKNDRDAYPGHGTCADNPLADLWPDPAIKETK